MAKNNGCLPHLNQILVYYSASNKRRVRLIEVHGKATGWQYVTLRAWVFPHKSSKDKEDAAFGKIERFRCGGKAQKLCN